jgi:hypothetical protein
VRPAPRPAAPRPRTPAQLARDAVAQRNRTARERQHTAALAASAAMIRGGVEAGLGAANQAREFVVERGPQAVAALRTGANAALGAARGVYQTGRAIGQVGYRAGQLGYRAGQLGYRAGQVIHSGARWALRRAQDAQFLIQRMQNARRMAVLQRQAQANEAVNAAAQEQMAAIAARFAQGRLAPAED